MTERAQIIEYPAEKLYTIGTVSKLTGVGAITLRAWERRYGLVKPVRKESGHRLYTRQHIDQINRITSLTQQGLRISQITPEMLETEMQGSAEDERPNDVWKEYLNGMIAALVSFDEDRLEEIYNTALSLYPIGTVTQKLLTPLLIELGVRWEAGDGGVAEEHFFSFYLRNKLGARFHHRPRGNRGSVLLIAGLPGEHHELGLLLFALAAHENGYRVIPLGANMPLADLESVSRQKKPSAIILAGAIEPSRRTLNDELPKLVSKVSVPVTVGGLSSVYACDAIDKAGAVALGRDIDIGLQRLSKLLS
ncbi:MAG: MerR family transcriptional regulator [Xanthomonadales bacterium]|nr:MerR family transcriptional regulator [Gammaproteobacteria bacterium]MBT8051717.1 MerR family transcriptional regulator [Gammaproteobacteria bacterium]MBT8057922.1 MerR family transcriptional regulator [Gammaproteobacteria bacterium]NNL05733.1 MerR family transcriptional regulator [Xanthomonadales bacterium]